MRLLILYVLVTICGAIPFPNWFQGSLGIPDAFEKRLIKVGENDYQVVTEKDKLQYRSEGKKFIDITNHISVEQAINLGLINPVGEHLTLFEKIGRVGSKQLLSLKKEIPVYAYPEAAQHQKAVKKVLDSIKRSNLVEFLGTFTSFFTRYYKSQTGVESAHWLLKQVQAIVEPVSAKVDIEVVSHKQFDQFSIIARIPGETTDKVVVGAHQDSTTFVFPSLIRAPGADDDGSGTVTLLEALRVLIDAYAEGTFVPYNTLEFHWYAAEEGGLLGSIDVFSKYYEQQATVLGMLQQDMTGSTAKTFDEGIEEHFGLMSDYVSKNLNQFIKKIVDEYCDITYHETSCGYACSDHASALENGFPASFLIESESNLTSGFIHLTLDTLDRLDFDHMVQHTKLTVGFAYELSLAKGLY